MAITEITAAAARGSGDRGNGRWLRLSVHVLLTVAAMLLLSSCAAGPNPSVGTGQEPAGFLLGLWHGLIVPVTFVISLFSEEVSLYEVTNNGNWYDFGFVLGVMTALGGGGGASASGRRRTRTT